jgi:hypothetical protein
VSSPRCEDCGKAKPTDTCPFCGYRVCQVCAEREGERCCPKGFRARWERLFKDMEMASIDGSLVTEDFINLVDEFSTKFIDARNDLVD